MSRNNRNRRNNQEKKKSNVIRCKIHNRPVFEHETCPQFSIKNSTNNEKTCINCLNSF